MTEPVFLDSSILERQLLNNAPNNSGKSILPMM